MPDTQEKARILICDDEVLIAADLASRLKGLGYTICGQATSTEQALELVEQHQPDLVMMDIVLHGEMEGIVAAEVIRDKWGIPVVFLTAYADTDILKRAQLTCPSGYLIKPFRDQEIKVTSEMALYVAQVHAESRECEQKHHSLVENMMYGVLDTSPDGTIHSANPAACRILDMTESEILQAGRNAIVDMKDPRLLAALAEREKTGKFEGELNLRKKDGTIIQVELSMAVYYNSRGQQRTGMVFRDITDRKKAEEIVRESEKQYRDLIHKIQAAIVVHGLDTRVISSNSKAQEILGLTEDQMLGKTAMDPAWKFLNADGENLLLSDYPVNKVLATQQPLKDMVGGICRPQTDDIIWVLVNANPVFNNENNIQQVIVTFMDITEHKLTEKALIESESLLNAMGMMTKVGGWELDANTFEVKWTEQTYRIFEFPLDHEPYGSSTINLCHPDDREKLTTTIQSALDQGEPFDLELRYNTLKGNNIWIRSLCNPRVVDGKVVKLRGTIQDITDRKQAEEAHLESEAQIRAFADAARDGVIMSGPDGNITFWNASAERIFGYGPSDALGKNLHILLAPERFHDSYHNTFPFFQKTGKGAAIGKTLELQGLHKDGREIPIELSLSSVKLSDGWHAVGIVRDITNRKKAEEALKESENRYRSMIEFSPLGIGNVNMEGVVVNANPALASMLGYEAEELIGMNARDTLTHPDDFMRERKFLKPLLSGETSSYNLEKRFRHKNGKYYWYNVTVAKMLGPSGDKVLFGFIEDINNRKQLEQEREKLINDLQNALAEIKQLRGIFPICANCKKIRDDQGYWQQVEKYIMDRTDARFSHGLCPDCLKELYPDISDKILKKMNKDE